MLLWDLQDQVKKWSLHNFGQVPRWQPLLGAVEEVGELAHSFLKREQKIRGTDEEHEANEKDAIGDIVVYLADFCWRSGYDLNMIVEDTWETVKKRDWTQNRTSGNV